MGRVRVDGRIKLMCGRKEEEEWHVEKVKGGDEMI